MKNYIFLLPIIFIHTLLNAQSYIEATPIFKYQTKQNFTNEWQYLSTDLYLINGNKFTNLLRNINPTHKRRRFKKKERINNILVTAQIQGIKEYEDIVYPVFNFQISQDKKGNDVINVSETEVLRLIDNLPLSTINGQIEAKIGVKAYTNQNKGQMYKFIGRQLEIIANINNPTEAVLDLIGEFGKLMEKNTTGEEYHFESTIRVYEEQSFNKKFYSIAVFLFKPSNGLRLTIDSTQLINYINTTDNPIFDKNKLRELINFYTYPIIVAINYRSKYIPQIPDEITFENLKARTVKNETDYKKGLISADIYIQEKNLIEFLERFAQFKLDVNNYELDYKAKITDDYSIELFIILQDYWQMKNSFKIILNANKDNPLFKNEFKPIYEIFLSKAELYLESNASLRSIKEMVNILYELENNPNIKLDSALTENYLAKLYSIELPKRELYSDEAKTIKKWIETLENFQYNNIYRKKIDLLSSLPINDSTYKQVKILQEQAGTTNCQLCRDKANDFITNFYIQYNKYLQNKELNRYYNLKINCKNFVFQQLKQYQCIKTKLDSLDTLYSGGLPEYLQYISKEVSNIKLQLDNLLNIVNKEKAPEQYNELKNLNNTIQTTMNNISAEMRNICNTKKELCKCQE